MCGVRPSTTINALIMVMMKHWIRAARPRQMQRPLRSWRSLPVNDGAGALLAAAVLAGIVLK
jgi:hypothetical protein